MQSKPAMPCTNQLASHPFFARRYACSHIHLCMHASMYILLLLFYFLREYPMRPHDVRFYICSCVLPYHLTLSTVLDPNSP
uniref:Uncharacterized protein n=1 Tax=Oryza brachyantha TaxID=4533 RepID=J3MWK4_ORYBR